MKRMKRMKRNAETIADITLTAKAAGETNAAFVARSAATRRTPGPARTVQGWFNKAKKANGRRDASSRATSHGQTSVGKRGSTQGVQSTETTGDSLFRDRRRLQAEFWRATRRRVAGW
jgi:hypothetical protein